MSRKIIMMVGEPAVGKTTIMRAFLEKVKPWVASTATDKLPAIHVEAKRLWILGKYDEGEKFAGTDRLSMSIQPIATKFITETKDNVMFEGDRLGNRSFVDHILSLDDVDFEILHIEASEKTKKQRHVDRADTQDDTFLKGRRTKVSNIAHALDLIGVVTTMDNNTPDDLKLIVDQMMAMLDNEITL